MRHYHKWNNLPEVRRCNPSKAPAVTCTKPAQIQSEWRSDQERTRNNTAQNMSCRTAAWDAARACSEPNRAYAKSLRHSGRTRGRISEKDKETRLIDYVFLRACTDVAFILK